jgi:hypothetical protein
MGRREKITLSARFVVQRGIARVYDALHKFDFWVGDKRINRSAEEHLAPQPAILFGQVAAGANAAASCNDKCGYTAHSDPHTFKLPLGLGSLAARSGIAKEGQALIPRSLHRILPNS